MRRGGYCRTGRHAYIVRKLPPFIDPNPEYDHDEHDRLRAADDRVRPRRDQREPAEHRERDREHDPADRARAVQQRHDLGYINKDVNSRQGGSNYQGTPTIRKRLRATRVSELYSRLI